ncbi:MAG: DUF2336 domain-containing protein [Siculibacillus sp.]
MPLSATSCSRDLADVADRVADFAEVSPEFCERLTSSLIQLYRLAGPEFAEEDLGRFDAVMIRIAPAARTETRAELSGSIAATPTPPRRILLLLAHDGIEVAGPVLRHSPALNDDDLVDIARNCGTGHMEAIAERPQLSIRITDVLVLRGDDVVRRIVAGNHGARLSDKSFSRLSLQARQDAYVENFLLHRRDLPELVIHFLSENGSDTTRAALADRRGDRGSAPLPRARSLYVAEESWLEPYDFDAAADILPSFQAARHQLDSFVRRLAQAGSFPELVHVLTNVSGLPIDVLKHMMAGTQTEPFATVARAVGLKVETVRAALTIGPWQHRLDARSREATVLAFQALSVDEARVRLRRMAADFH